MNKEDFTFKLADYFMMMLKKNGREMKFSDLEEWARREMLSIMPESDDRLFYYHTDSAKNILKELGLVKLEGKMIEISLEARTLSEPISVREFLYQKKKKVEFDDRTNVRNYHATIAGIVIPSLIALLQLLLNQGNTGNVIGWLLVGAVLGYFGNELIKR